jgi:hypothetical protein
MKNSEKNVKFLFQIEEEAYVKPSIQVYEIETEEMIAGSPNVEVEIFNEESDEDW